MRDMGVMMVGFGLIQSHEETHSVMSKLIFARMEAIEKKLGMAIQLADLPSCEEKARLCAELANQALEGILQLESGKLVARTESHHEHLGFLLQKMREALAGMARD